jgi:anaerobic magnesium-protoporphyrin IX monomethyl ester cyclase
MQVLLINPPYKKVYKNISDAKGIIPPLGIASIASYIKLHGFNVEILDANATNLDIQKTINTAIEKAPEVIGITATTSTFNISSKILEKIKISNNEILTVIGGAHASATGGQLLAEHPHIDVVIKGEGEASFLNVLKNFEAKDLSNIKGISYRNSSNEVVDNEPNNEYIDINKSPFPAYELLPMEKYNLPIHHIGIGKKIPRHPFFMIFTGRACPMDCNFCASKTIWGNNVRLKNAERVIAEIDFLVKEYDVKVIDIADDIFTLNKTRLHNILDLLISRNYNLYFNCSSRVDTIDEYDLIKLKKAGCYLIRYGVESGSQEMLNKMNKMTSISNIKETFALTHKLGITSSASFILGYPGETKETAMQTIRLAQKLKTSISLFFFAIPYLGTPLHKFVVDNNYKIEKNPEQWINFPDEPIIEIPEIQKKELVKLRKLAYRKSFVNFRTFFASIKSVNSKQSFRNMLKAGFSLFKLLIKP